MRKDSILSILRKNRFFSEFLNEKARGQLRRYLITGFTSFGLEYSLLILLTETFDLWYIYSNTLAFFTSFWYNFLMNRYWSFRSTYSFPRQLLLYGILLFINLGISNTLMYVFTDILGMIYLISKIFVVGVITLWNFVLYKKIIYIE